ncbi:MAG: deoxynucleoside kinase, partial [archaeon]|nr:deoxynucleoside kinase [archaeon]
MSSVDFSTVPVAGKEGLLIIVEGNISAGKTTLCMELSKQLGCQVFLEPTLTNPYLADFYQDPARWGLKMQLWLLRQRFCTYIDSVLHALRTGQSVVLDRSVYSDWVFAENSRSDGTISPEGFEYYLAIRSQMISRLPPPHIAVFLDVEPQECHRRIHDVRKRDCESGIPVEYLAGLHRCYHLFVEDLRERGSCVLRYDWNGFGSTPAIAADIRANMSSTAALSLELHEFLADKQAINEAMMPSSFELMTLARHFEDTDRVFDFLTSFTASADETALLLQESPSKRQRSTPPASCSAHSSDVIVEPMGLTKRVVFSVI